MSRPLAVMLMMVVCVLGAMGCGSSSSEKVAEQVAKGASGVKDVDIDNNGKSVKITGKNGDQLEISGSDDGKLVDGWPTDVPLPDGAKITSSGKIATGDTGSQFTVSATVKMSASDVLDFYKSELTRYKQTTTMSTGDTGGFATYEGSKYGVTVTAEQGDGGSTTMSVMVSPSVKK